VNFNDLDRFTGSRPSCSIHQCFLICEACGDKGARTETGRCD
jgi:hypothetical protein